MSVHNQQLCAHAAMADGATIQKANEVALANGMAGPSVCIGESFFQAKCMLRLVVISLITLLAATVKAARAAGLKVPVVLMGYYNPFVSVNLLAWCAVESMRKGSQSP
jgi:tryptophan synthase alpha subunit